MTPDDLARAAGIARSFTGPAHRALRDVSRATGITEAEIVGRSRVRPLVRARQLVAFVARRDGATYGQIAKALRRDRTTIIHGVRAEAARREASRRGSYHAL